MRANHQKQRGEIVLGRILLASGLVLLGAAIWAGRRQHTILELWPRVEAEVTGSEVTGGQMAGRSDAFRRTYRTQIHFRFTSGGRQVVASASEESSNQPAADLTARTYASGTRHTIRY